MERQNGESVEAVTASSTTAMKSKRTRITLKPLSNQLVNSGDDNSSSMDDTSDCELSEDEWNMPSRKYRQNKKKTIPKQTLKMKLAEKTKHLRKISKMNCTQNEEKCDQKVSKKVSESVGNDNAKYESARVPTKTELCKIEETETKFSQLDSRNVLDKVIKCDSDAMTESHKLNVKKEAMEKDVVIKQENKKETGEENFSDKKVSKNQEPIVIMYSYSVNHSPIISENQTHPGTPLPSLTLNSSCKSPQQATNLATSSGIQCSTPSIFHAGPSFHGSASHSFAPNQVTSKPIRSNTLCNVDRRTATCSAVSTSLYSTGSNCSDRNSAKNIHQKYSSASSNSSPISLGKSNVQRTPTQRTPTYFQRTPPTQRTSKSKFMQQTSPASQQTSRIARTSRTNNSVLSRTRKLFSPAQTERLLDSNDTTKDDVLYSLSRNVTPLKSASRLSFDNQNSNGASCSSVLKKFNNISPNGTVIHTGTGSVTITPRKVTPERPPVQRKLFKNEIEGSISCRSIRGTLQYVVNLANGTHIALTNFQVQKLREQHNGVLPVKLKIPVPCDVADKIEPSFLIED